MSYYEVMDGFEPLDVSNRLVPTEISMTVTNNLILFSPKAREILWQRKYVQVFVNRKSKELMFHSSPDLDQNSIMVTKTGKTGCFSNKHIRVLVEELCRFYVSVVKVMIPGKVIPAKPNAIVFDLSKAVSRQKRKMTKTQERP